MLTLEQCRKYVDEDVSDEQLESIRNGIYEITGSVLDNYFQQIKENLCKKQSFTVEFPLQNKAPKDTGLKAKNIVVDNMLNKKDMK